MEPHEPKVLFLGTPVKQEYSRQAALRNISELVEPPEDPDDQVVLTYIKRLDTYMLDLGGAFLSFAGDAEASVLVLGEYLGRICIKTEASH